MLGETQLHFHPLKHNRFYLRKASGACFQHQSTNASSLKLEYKISLALKSALAGQTAGATFGHRCPLLRSPWRHPILCISALCRLVADHKTSFCRAKPSQSGVPPRLASWKSFGSIIGMTLSGFLNLNSRGEPNTLSFNKHSWWFLTHSSLRTTGSDQKF